MLYTAFALGANLGAAGADVTGLLTGEMKKFAMREVPLDLPEVVLLDMTNGAHSMGEYRGKWVVLNFWATWCAPCREEMPALDRLQAAMPDLAVLPVATGRNDVAAITRFFEEAGVRGLTVLRDPKSELARGMGVLGLPVTVILNPEGREVGRMIGGAVWDGPEAMALIAALMADG
jgi:thiol-disulfide isomerase/thioredoxin